MSDHIRYSLETNSLFGIENFLGTNNRTNHSFFWLDEDDNGARYFRFTSAFLSEFENPDEIIEKASQIVSIFEGIFTLLDRNNHATEYFTFRDIYDHDMNKPLGKSKKKEIFKIDLDFSAISPKIENSPVNQIYELFEKICEEPFLINLFFLLSKPVDYRMLYMIYDDVRYFLKEVHDRNFLDDYKNPLNDFTHTANNYEVLGFYARHGRTGYQPPKSPMSLEDSKNLIFDILVKLLQNKFAITLPDYWGLNSTDHSDIEF